MNKESNKINAFFPTDYLIDQIIENIKIGGDPSIEENVCKDQLIKLRKMGCLTEKQENRLFELQIAHFDGGDMFKSIDSGR